MAENPFFAFIDLVSLDQAIRTTHTDIAKLQQEIDQILVQKKEIGDRFEQFKTHVKELRNLVKDQEKTMKELDEREQLKRKQLDASQNIKVYQPLKKDIERLKQEQHEAETHLMTIWNKLDISQKELEEQETQFNQKRDHFITKLVAKQEAIDELTKTLNAQKAERPAKEAQVPEEWLDKYTYMRMRVPDPVVPVLHNSCSVCFYTIIDQELLRLRRRALTQCKGCFRLLYMQEAMDESHKESADSAT